MTYSKFITAFFIIPFFTFSQEFVAHLTSEQSQLFFDGEKVGEGKVVVMNREIVDAYPKFHEIVVKTPGYLEANYVIYAGKKSSYEREYTFLNELPLTMRQDNENYVRFGMCSGVMTSNRHTMFYKGKNIADIEEKKRKGEEGHPVSVLFNTTNDEEFSKRETALSLMMSREIAPLLEKERFTDSLKQLFVYNFQNTLIIDVRITRFDEYFITENPNKVYMTGSLKGYIESMWYIKNSYGEIMDSIAIKAVGGEASNYGNFFDLMPRALSHSLLELQKSELFKKYVSEPVPDQNSYAELVLNTPVSPVRQLEDAEEASVIIQLQDGHGSGFAITNDGYVMTNYHVIAGSYPSVQPAFDVIMPDGSKQPAEVVRIDRLNDVALLKVAATFTKAFTFPSAKGYKNLMEVYTIGAPESIELGRTVTPGLLSNERQLGTRDLLQLSMSLNRGNSGGPLFERSGALHGIVVSKLTGPSIEGLSFAIPAYTIVQRMNLVFR